MTSGLQTGARRGQNALLLLMLAVIAFGCSRRRPADELATLQSRVPATNVQAWAKQILTRYTNRTELFPYFPGLSIDATMVVLSNPPSFLGGLSMGRMGPSILVSPAGPSSNRCVSLLYAESFGFGGPGHFIEAGAEDFREATNAECLEWAPGVYYRYTHSP